MTTLYALHGFLGRPEDWNILQGHLNQTIKLETLDLFNSPFIPVDRPLKEAAKEFNAFVALQDPPSRIIMGYSLGGRLALQALSDSNSLWKGAILISTGLGLQSDQEKSERVKADNSWAERFEKEPWKELMASWNKQPVFSQEKSEIAREEKDYSRQTLAQVINNWSVGLQEDLTPLVKRLNIPILWVVGEEDKKYAEVAKRLELAHPKSRVWLAPGSHHRVPWETTVAFISQINDFFASL